MLLADSVTVEGARPLRVRYATVEPAVKAEKSMKIGKHTMMSLSAPCSRARREWMMLWEAAKMRSTVCMCV